MTIKSLIRNHGVIGALRPGLVALLLLVPSVHGESESRLRRDSHQTAQALPENLAYIDRLNIADLDEIAFFEHGDDASSTVFIVSSNGNYLASGAGDGSLALWNLESGEKGSEVRDAHAGRITSLAFRSELADHLASGSADTSVRVWIRENVQIIEKTGKLHERQFVPEAVVRAVSYSEDGRVLAIAAEDGSVYVRRAGDMSEIMTFENVHLSWVNSVVLTSQDLNLDGAKDILWMASGSGDQCIGIWSSPLAEPEQLWQRRPICTGSPITSLAFTNFEGQLRLAAGHDNSFVNVWEFSIPGPGELPYHLVFGDEIDTQDKVRSVAFSPDSELLAVGQQNGWIQFFDVAADGEEIVGEKRLRVGSDVGSVAFSPAQDWIAASSKSGIHFFGIVEESPAVAEETEVTEEVTAEEPEEEPTLRNGTEEPIQEKETPIPKPIEQTPTERIDLPEPERGLLSTIQACEPQIALLTLLIPIGILLTATVIVLVRLNGKRASGATITLAEAILIWLLLNMVVIGAAIFLAPGLRCSWEIFIVATAVIATTFAGIIAGLNSFTDIFIKDT